MVWAGMETNGGSKFYTALKTYAGQRLFFELRIRTNINPFMRIKWGNRLFTILAINQTKTSLLNPAKEVI